MFYNVLQCFTCVSWCFMMFSESRNNRRCCIGDHRLRDGRCCMAMMPQGLSISPRTWSHAKLRPQWIMETGVTLFLEDPSGIFLPGTELLQSPFRMEFSMGSRSRRYRRSLWLHRLFLRSYRRSLRSCRDPWGDPRTHGRRCGDADRCATR